MTIPDYPWFGPRHGMGWGWAPISWESKAISFVVFTVMLFVCFFYGRSKITLYVVGSGVLLLLIVCAVTGTPPG
jgi:hypothetical protein